MSYVYHIVGYLLGTRLRDRGDRAAPSEATVDGMVREMRENGFISAERMAAHDTPADTMESPQGRNWRPPSP